MKEEGVADPEDELRLDPLLDQYANRFLPWVTVLINEPLYYFLAPAVVDAVASDMRRQKADCWPDVQKERHIRQEIRFLEALICDDLMSRLLPKRRQRLEPDVERLRYRIIGSKRWQRFWANARRGISRRTFSSEKAIQKSFGMHPTTRYYARGAVLFSGERAGQRNSPIDAILDQLGDNRTTWWDSDPDLRTAVKWYSKTFQGWLRDGRRSAHPQLQANLSVGERRAIKRSLLPNGREHRELPAASFLRKSWTTIRGLKDGDSTSTILTRLSRRNTAHRSDLKAAAAAVQASALIRFLYRSLVFYPKVSCRNPVCKKESCRDDSDCEAQFRKNLRRTLSRLAIIRLRHDGLAAYAREGAEFLGDAIREAQDLGLVGFKELSTSALARLIAQRERKVKKQRSRLYLSSAGVAPRRISGAIPEKTALFETGREYGFRLYNAQHVIERMMGRRGK